jgi:hypothetical protein
MNNSHAGNSDWTQSCSYAVVGRWKSWFSILLLLLMTDGSAWAQNLSVDWHKVAGGAGTSTNAQFAVTGTIGQPDTGRLAGGSFTIGGGFWAFAAVVQSPGGPLLNLRLNAANSVVISWPSRFSGYVLQSSTNLTAPNWSNVLLTPSDDGTNMTLVFTQAFGSQFFRLIKP